LTLTRTSDIYTDLPSFSLDIDCQSDPSETFRVKLISKAFARAVLSDVKKFALERNEHILILYIIFSQKMIITPREIKLRSKD